MSCVKDTVDELPGQECDLVASFLLGTGFSDELRTKYSEMKLCRDEESGSRAPLSYNALVRWFSETLERRFYKVLLAILSKSWQIQIARKRLVEEKWSLDIMIRWVRKQ